MTTGEEFTPVDLSRTKASDDESAEQARYSFFSKCRLGIFIFAREFVWKLGKWKTPELDAFLAGAEIPADKQQTVERMHRASEHKRKGVSKYDTPNKE